MVRRAGSGRWRICFLPRCTLSDSQEKVDLPSPILVKMQQTRESHSALRQQCESWSGGYGPVRNCQRLNLSKSHMQQTFVVSYLICENILLLSIRISSSQHYSAVSHDKSYCTIVGQVKEIAKWILSLLTSRWNVRLPIVRMSELPDWLVISPFTCQTWQTTQSLWNIVQYGLLVELILFGYFWCIAFLIFT